MKPKELSQQLREGSGEFLALRRRVAALSLVAMGSMGLIALYQLGLIKHLPEPPLPRLDADEVDAAREAYAHFSTPDAVLGLQSYAFTLRLAAQGGEDRPTERPWLALALAAKVAFDIILGAKLTRDQWTKHRAVCFWCLLATAASFAMGPLVIPEARVAFRQVRPALSQGRYLRALQVARSGK